MTTPLRGMYHWQTENEDDINKSYQWPVKAGCKDSKEALITAVQEQALSIRSIEEDVYHSW